MTRGAREKIGRIVFTVVIHSRRKWKEKKLRTNFFPSEWWCKHACFVLSLMQYNTIAYNACIPILHVTIRHFSFFTTSTKKKYVHTCYSREEKRLACYFSKLIIPGQKTKKMKYKKEILQFIANCMCTELLLVFFFHKKVFLYESFFPTWNNKLSLAFPLNIHIHNVLCHNPRGKKYYIHLCLSPCNQEHCSRKNIASGCARRISSSLAELCSSTFFFLAFMKQEGNNQSMNKVKKYTTKKPNISL